MVEFAGFEMPVQYRSIVAEHTAVRERVGLFDVSHMGQIHFSGRDAVAIVEKLVNEVSQFTGDIGFEDDVTLIVAKVTDETDQA